MAGTYRQCYFHLVFAVKNREALIKKEWRDELEKYISGIVHNHEHKLLAISAMPDHIHIFLGYNPNHLIPEGVWCIYTFPCTVGYGCEIHRKSGRASSKKTFREEYIEFLVKNNINFNENTYLNFSIIK
jgi:REP element-mobilizing transposase RayT